jgi:hypothetical protein
VLIEEQTKNDLADTWEICQDVKREIRRSLDDGEAPEGTPIYATMHWLLGFGEPEFLSKVRHRLPGCRVRFRATQ